MIARIVIEVACSGYGYPSEEKFSEDCYGESAVTLAGAPENKTPVDIGTAKGRVIGRTETEGWKEIERKAGEGKKTDPPQWNVCPACLKYRKQ